MSLQCDISNESQVRQAFDHIHNSLGRVDVLINHASGAGWDGITDTTAEQFEQSWRVSALGAFHCCKSAVPDMLQNGNGVILFTGATSAVRGRVGALSFSSSKFAVRGLAWSLAAELGNKGIHVSHIVID